MPGFFKKNNELARGTGGQGIWFRGDLVFSPALPPPIFFLPEVHSGLSMVYTTQVHLYVLAFIGGNEK